MPLLEGLDFADLAEALTALGVDAWLLYDFRRVNPVAERILGPTGMGTRRLFIFLPRGGKPVAVAHRIELQPLAGFPGEVSPYGSWRELHDLLRALVRVRTELRRAALRAARRRGLAAASRSGAAARLVGRARGGIGVRRSDLDRLRRASARRRGAPGLADGAGGPRRRRRLTAGALAHAGEGGSGKGPDRCGGRRCGARRDPRGRVRRVFRAPHGAFHRSGPAWP